MGSPLLPAFLAMLLLATLATGVRAAALRDRALESNASWAIVESLSTEVGPRLAGAEAEAPWPRLVGGPAGGAGLRQPAVRTRVP